MYVIRDSEGKFVGKSRSKATAHRKTRRSKAVANRAVATRDRKFQQSDHFSAIVMGGRGDTIVVTYQGPSLSTARVKAKIAASQWQKPVSVIDDQWRTIATYQPDANHARRRTKGSTSNRATEMDRETPRASWIIESGYPDGWTVRVRVGSKSVGRYYARSGGEWILNADGTQGQQVAGTLDVRAPMNKAKFSRWIRRHLAEVVHDMQIDW